MHLIISLVIYIIMLHRIVCSTFPRMKSVHMAGIRTARASVPRIRPTNAIALTNVYVDPETEQLLAEEKEKVLPKYRSGQLVNIEVQKFIPVGALVKILGIADTSSAVPSYSTTSSAVTPNKYIKSKLPKPVDSKLSRQSVINEPNNEIVNGLQASVGDSVVSTVDQGLIAGEELDAYLRQRGRDVSVGDLLTAYVGRVEDDGRITVCIRPVGINRVRDVKEMVLTALRNSDTGSIPIGDKTSAEVIDSLFAGVSKRDFKSAVGILYKEKLCIPDAFTTKLSASNDDVSSVAKTNTRVNDAKKGTPSATQKPHETRTTPSSAAAGAAAATNTAQSPTAAATSSAATTTSATTTSATTTSTSEVPFVPNRIRSSILNGTFSTKDSEDNNKPKTANKSIFYANHEIVTYFITKLPLSITRDDLILHLIGRLSASIIEINAPNARARAAAAAAGNTNASDNSGSTNQTTKRRNKTRSAIPLDPALKPAMLAAVRLPRYSSGKLKGFAFVDFIVGKKVAATERLTLQSQIHLSTIKSQPIVCEESKITKSSNNRGDDISDASVIMDAMDVDDTVADDDTGHANRKNRSQKLSDDDVDEDVSKGRYATSNRAKGNFRPNTESSFHKSSTRQRSSSESRPESRGRSRSHSSRSASSPRDENNSQQREQRGQKSRSSSPSYGTKRTSNNSNSNSDSSNSNSQKKDSRPYATVTGGGDRVNRATRPSDGVNRAASNRAARPSDGDGPRTRSSSSVRNQQTDTETTSGRSRQQKPQQKRIWK